MKINQKVIFLLLLGNLISFSSCQQDQVLKNMSLSNLTQGKVAMGVADFLSQPSDGTIYLHTVNASKQSKVFSGQAFFTDNAKNSLELSAIKFGNVNYMLNGNNSKSYNYTIHKFDNKQPDNNYNAEVKTTASTCFGKNTTISVLSKEGKELVNETFYVPQEVDIDNVAVGDNQPISVTEKSFTLNWNKDTQNEKGVFIQLEPFIPSDKPAKYIWSEDNGSYILSADQLSLYKDSNNMVIVKVIRDNYKLVDDKGLTYKVFAIAEASCVVKLTAN
jgi:hypothetical protein